MKTLNDLMKEVDAEKLVEPQWRAAFLHFIQDGSAERDFLAYLEADANYQKAVDMAFTVQAEAFQSLAQALDAARSCP